MLEALVDETKRQIHIKSGQVSVITNMCEKLKISSDELLTKDVTTHQEFMKCLSDVAVNLKMYFTLKSEWQQFKKHCWGISKVQIAVREAELVIHELKTSLLEISSIVVSHENLSSQLQSCQQKLSKIMEVLPIVFKTKPVVETAIARMHSVIRARKSSLHLRCNFQVFASNSLGLSWDSAAMKLNDLEKSRVFELLKVN